jgi:hypothetical protein
VSPQEHEYSRIELEKLAEHQAKDMLGKSWHDARQLLADGALEGTVAQAELRLLAFLLDA